MQIIIRIDGVFMDATAKIQKSEISHHWKSLFQLLQHFSNTKSKNEHGAIEIYAEPGLAVTCTHKQLDHFLQHSLFAGGSDSGGVRGPDGGQKGDSSHGRDRGKFMLCSMRRYHKRKSTQKITGYVGPKLQEPIKQQLGQPKGAYGAALIAWL